MKKIVFLLAALLLCITTYADNDRITQDINELPAISREFLTTWFPNALVSHIKIERNMLGVKGYDVILTDGTDIEFDKSGQWTEIDGNRSPLPMGIIPGTIQNFLRQNYADQGVMKIEKKSYETEVKLDNGIELTFDRNGNIKEIDD